MLVGIEKSHHQSETETIKRSAKTAATVASTENAPEIFEPASLAGAWAEICDAPLAALLGFIAVVALFGILFIGLSQLFN